MRRASASHIRGCGVLVAQVRRHVLQQRVREERVLQQCRVLLLLLPPAAMLTHVQQHFILKWLRF